MYQLTNKQGKFKMKELKMDDTANKFIIMARISVSLREKGLLSYLMIGEDYCILTVQLGTSDNFFVVENVSDKSTTEQELLEWWAIIEGDLI